LDPTLIKSRLARQYLKNKKNKNKNNKTNKGAVKKPPAARTNFFGFLNFCILTGSSVPALTVADPTVDDGALRTDGPLCKIG